MWPHSYIAPSTSRIYLYRDFNLHFKSSDVVPFHQKYYVFLFGSDIA